MIQDMYGTWNWSMGASILINRGTLVTNLNVGDWDGDQVRMRAPH